jgi:hypothetical protein
MASSKVLTMREQYSVKPSKALTAKGNGVPIEPSKALTTKDYPSFTAQ